MTPKEFLIAKGWSPENPTTGGVLFTGITELLEEYSNTKLTEANKLLLEASSMIDVIRFEEGEEVDQNDLEGRINEFLEKI